VRRVLEQGGAAEDNLSICEAQRAPFGDPYRIAFGFGFHRVRFIDQQNARGEPSEIAGRAPR
jgi:hypothetical protein